MNTDFIPLCGVLLCLPFLLPPAFSHAESHSSNVAQHRQILNQYCVSCHNQVLKTAGLMLDQADLENLGKNRQLWEQVLTKLTLRAMPPVDMPRPDEHAYAASSEGGFRVSLGEPSVLFRNELS